MTCPRPTRLLPPFLAALLTACSLLPGSSPTPAQSGTPPANNPTPLPAAEVVFLLTPPVGTPQGASLALVLLDDIAGPAFERTLIPMGRLADGRWEARFTPPAGSLIRYHYRRLSPTPADETNVWGEAVPYRLAFLPGPAQVEDVAAGWTDQPSRAKRAASSVTCATPPPARLCPRCPSAPTG